MKTRAELPVRSKQELDRLIFHMPRRPRHGGRRWLLASWVFSAVLLGGLVGAFVVSSSTLFAFMAAGAGVVLSFATLLLAPLALSLVFGPSRLVLALGRHELQVGPTAFARGRIDRL